MEKAAIHLQMWINEKRQVTDEQMFEFVFHDAISLQKEAVALINQISNILDILSDGQGEEIKWKAEINDLNVNEPHIIFDLNCLSDTLRSNYKNENFEKVKWASEYQGKLAFIYNQLRA